MSGPAGELERGSLKDLVTLNQRIFIDSFLSPFLLFIESFFCQNYPPEDYLIESTSKKERKKKEVGKKEVGSVHYDISTVQYSRPAFSPTATPHDRHETEKAQIYGIDSMDRLKICNYSDLLVETEKLN